MQYKIGTVAVTPGLARIHGAGTYWKTRSGITAGCIFKLTVRPELFEIAAPPSWEDANGNSYLDLTAPFVGMTMPAANYMVAKEFTLNKHIPELSVGDQETAYIFTRAMRTIDAALGSVLYGDTLIDTINTAPNSKIDEFVIDPDIARDADVNAAIIQHNVTAPTVSTATPYIHHARLHSMTDAFCHSGVIDDTIHGSRGNGTLHTVAVAGGNAGFMTGADKTKLDGITAGAKPNQNILAGEGLAGGGSGDTVTINLVPGAGITTSSDLTAVDFSGIAPSPVGSTNAVGASNQLPRADHVHGLFTIPVDAIPFETANPSAIGLTVSVGLRNYLSRGDHAHVLENALFNIAYPQDVAETPSVGTSSLLSRSDHVHRSTGGLSDNPPNDVSPVGRTAGVTMRSSRWDHVHYHGALPGSTVTALHELAGTVAAGFMSGVDRLAMNILNGGPSSDASALHFHPTSGTTWEQLATNEVGATVTGTTLGNVMTLQFYTPYTGYYEVSWYCECQSSLAAQGVRVRIRETSPVAQDYADVSVDVLSTTAYSPNSGMYFKNIATAGSTVTVTMDMCSTSAVTTANVRRARMAARRMSN